MARGPPANPLALCEAKAKALEDLVEGLRERMRVLEASLAVERASAASDELRRLRRAHHVDQYRIARLMRIFDTLGLQRPPLADNRLSDFVPNSLLCELRDRFQGTLLHNLADMRSVPRALHTAKAPQVAFLARMPKEGKSALHTANTQATNDGIPLESHIDRNDDQPPLLAPAVDDGLATNPSARSVPAANVPSTGVPGAHVPTTDVPAANVPAANVPANDVPVTDVPAADAPAVDAPAVDAPAADAPAADAPAADVPAADLPAADVPANDVRTTDLPAADVPNPHREDASHLKRRKPVPPGDVKDVPDMHGSEIDDVDDLQRTTPVTRQVTDADHCDSRPSKRQKPPPDSNYTNIDDGTGCTVDEYNPAAECFRILTGATSVIVFDNPRRVKITMNNPEKERQVSFWLAWKDGSMEYTQEAVQMEDVVCPDFLKEYAIDFELAQAPRFLLLVMGAVFDMKIEPKDEPLEQGTPELPSHK